MTDGLDGAPRDGAAGPELCSHCGDAIDTVEWHPVVARPEDDGFRVYPFCEESCRDDWNESDG